MTLPNSIAVHLPGFDPRSISEIDAEILEELEFHVAMRTQDNIQAGMPAGDAAAHALARFGDFERVRKTCRSVVLGERIMMQRVQTVLTALLVAAVVVMGVSMYNAQRANSMALTELASAIREMADRPDASGHSPSWYADRPKVVATFPADNATDVDPTTAEIRVTFDHAMANGSWSWVQTTKAAFPETTGDVHYLDDGKTCVMPVKLEPGTKYVIWFNTNRYQNFKDAEGRSAEPHMLTFTTRN